MQRILHSWKITEEKSLLLLLLNQLVSISRANEIRKRFRASQIVSKSIPKLTAHHIKKENTHTHMNV